MTIIDKTESESNACLDINLPLSRVHPMEFSQTGTSTSQEPQSLVLCDCGRENPAGMRFCIQCGASLAEPCSRCGQIAVANQRFCGGCGAELAATMHQQIERFEMDLRNADEWQAQGQLDDALSLLIPISKLSHSRLLRYADEAKEKIQAIALLRDRGIHEAGPAHEEGCRRMAEKDYAGAIKTLQAIPASVRSSEIVELLEQRSPTIVRWQC